MALWYSSVTLIHNYKSSYLSLTLFSLIQFHSLGNLLNLAFCNLFLSCFIKAWMFCQCCLMIILLSFLLTIYIWCFIVREFVVVFVIDIVVVEAINKMTLMLLVTALWLVLCVFSWYWDYFIFYVVFWRFESLISSFHFMTMKVNDWEMMIVRDLSCITFRIVVDYYF